MRLLKTNRSLTLLLMLAAAAAGAQDGAGEPPRGQFLAAYTAARAGIRLVGTDSDALTGYVLYPYLEAARLGAALPDDPNWTAEDAAVRDFLARYADAPVTANLRLIWLNSLEQRGLAAEFLEHYRDELADVSLRCRQLRARIAFGDTDLIADQIRTLWLTASPLPLDCEPVFQWLRDAGPLDDELTAARVRLLLENGQAEFARVIARRLPDTIAAPLMAWADLIEQPLTALEDHIATRRGNVPIAALLDGWSRLSRDDPDGALGLYERLMAAIDSAEASRFTLALALGLAWDRRPEAVETFSRVGAAEMDDYALAWLARTALWSGAEAVARGAIERMSAEQRDSAAWRYWAARLSEDRASRNALYESLLPRDNYYSAVAAAQTNDRARLHPEAQERDLISIARLASRPAVERASELRLVGLPIAAAREWQFAAADFSPHERAQSVHLAMSLGWFDLGVATATDLEIFYDYETLYPRPYQDLVEDAARDFDVAEALIFAVMRQESLYRTDAESNAGARGLMQLTLGTARDVASEHGLAPVTERDLLDPATSIRLGAARLAQLIERYGGNIVPALAAYNAGPAAADRWLPPAFLAGDIWLENVPYNETREYVRRVLWNSVVFEWLDGNRVRARDWLRPVEPRG
jgi:soluble lytic murein transglycosylase